MGSVACSTLILMATFLVVFSLNGQETAGQSTYIELRDLANKHGLVLSLNQRSKTAIALRRRRAPVLTMQ
jgi:hypothetical protein